MATAKQVADARAWIAKHEAKVTRENQSDGYVVRLRLGDVGAMCGGDTDEDYDDALVGAVEELRSKLP